MAAILWLPQEVQPTIQQLSQLTINHTAAAAKVSPSPARFLKTLGRHRGALSHHGILGDPSTHPLSFAPTEKERRKRLGPAAGNHLKIPWKQPRMVMPRPSAATQRIKWQPILNACRAGKMRFCGKDPAPSTAAEKGKYIPWGRPRQ